MRLVGSKNGEKRGQVHFLSGGRSRDLKEWFQVPFHLKCDRRFSAPARRNFSSDLLPMPEPIKDLQALQFHRRFGRRPQRAVSAGAGILWIAVAIVAAVGFVYVIRALLDRTASTAAPPVAPSTESRPVRTQQVLHPEFPRQAAVHVPMVYGCVDRQGAVSLQSQPCAANQRTLRAIPAPPEVESPRRAPNAVQSPSRPAPAIPGGYVTARNDNRARQQECVLARREREQTLERVGLKRTYDLLRQLDEMVHRACNRR